MYNMDLFKLDEAKSAVIGVLIRDKETVDVLIPPDDPKRETEELSDLLLGNEERDIEGAIFPFLYAEGTSQIAQVFIAVEGVLPDVSGGHLEEIQILVNVMASKSRIKYSTEHYAGTSTGFIVGRLGELFYNKRISDIGVGKFRIDSVTPAKPNNNYYGFNVYMSYYDFAVKKL